jgi:cyclopropane fatty-acyl-phospholipid synthase-like methyltransferase
MRVDLLRSLPQARRDIEARLANKTPEIIAKAREFGAEYFDGPRQYGYGGYKYDGRWIPVAKEIIKHYGLHPGMKVLDIGCAKGFLVKDLSNCLPGLEAIGIDVSEYALNNCETEVYDKLYLGDARELCFSDRYFDLVLSINTLHNLSRADLIKALKEISRVSKGRSFIQIDAYENEKQKAACEAWILTAKFHGYPEDWYKVFEEAGYTGDYDWTIV